MSASLDCAVFDLDGTLVDTRHAVEEAYRYAGVDYPPDAWGRPWRDWCTPEQHRRKNAAYPRMLQLHATVGPAFKTAHDMLALRVPCFVLTSASWEAVGLVLRAVQLQIPVFAAEVPRAQKPAILEDIAYLHPVGNYYDDQETEVPDNWRFIKCEASS